MWQRSIAGCYQNNVAWLYRAAREAAQIEREGDYRRAAKIWAKANRAARNPINQTWSENRSDFCLMQVGREKLKEAVADDLHP